MTTQDKMELKRINKLKNAYLIMFIVSVVVLLVNAFMPMIGHFCFDPEYSKYSFIHIIFGCPLGVVAGRLFGNYLNARGFLKFYNALTNNLEQDK